MSIKTNNTSDLISVGNTDTTILQQTTGNRWVVTIINLHDHGGAGDTVELFKSADATSAAGERIDKVVLAADETKPATFAPFVLNSTTPYLIAKAATGAVVNLEAIYTSYDGDS